MNTTQMYSLKEMAKELGTTWQSIRSWKEQYYQFIPMDVDGKQVRFRPEALEILRFIQEAKEKGWDHHDIRAKLLEMTGQAHEDLAPALPEVDWNRQSADREVIEEMQGTILAVQEMQETILALQQEVRELKMKLEEVEIAKRDQALMDNLRNARGKKQKKGLWSRVMNFTL